jgi:hypothetical protein
MPTTERLNDTDLSRIRNALLAKQREFEGLAKLNGASRDHWVAEAEAHARIRETLLTMPEGATVKAR